MSLNPDCWLLAQKGELAHSENVRSLCREMNQLYLNSIFCDLEIAAQPYSDNGGRGKGSPMYEQKLERASVAQSTASPSPLQQVGIHGAAGRVGTAT